MTTSNERIRLDSGININAKFYRAAIENAVVIERSMKQKRRQPCYQAEAVQLPMLM